MRKKRKYKYYKREPEYLKRLEERRETKPKAKAKDLMSPEMRNAKSLDDIISCTKIDADNIMDAYYKVIDNEYGGKEPPAGINEKVLKKQMVNTLRHSMSSYELGLVQMGRINEYSKENYKAYKNTVLKSIAQYPYLTDECNRQMKLKSMVRIVNK